MKAQKFTFEGSQGHQLSGRLDLPEDGEPRAYALFAHCFTCGKNLKSISFISRALTAMGIAVLRFDFTGLGESEGDFADTNFSSNVEDLVAAADYMQKELRAPKILIGHSLGGAAVLQAAAKVPASVAVVTIGAPFEPAHVAHLFSGQRGEIEAAGEAEVLLAGRKFKIKKQFLDDLEESAVVRNIEGLRRALLVFHAPLDNTVGIENAARIFAAAKHPKSFISLDTADHLLSDSADAAYVGSVIAAWAHRYLEGGHE